MPDARQLFLGCKFTTRTNQAKRCEPSDDGVTPSKRSRSKFCFHSFFIPFNTATPLIISEMTTVYDECVALFPDSDTQGSELLQCISDGNQQVRAARDVFVLYSDQPSLSLSCCPLCIRQFATDGLFSLATGVDSFYLIFAVSAFALVSDQVGDILLQRYHSPHPSATRITGCPRLLYANRIRHANSVSDWYMYRVF